MQSKYIAIVGGDPMLLYMVTPVVDQSGNLLKNRGGFVVNAEQKNFK